MFSSPTAGKSVDNLSPLSSGARADYPIHRSVRGQAPLKDLVADTSASVDKDKAIHDQCQGEALQLALSTQ